MKIVNIKLTSSGFNSGPFKITDNLLNVLGTNITKDALILGVSFSVENSVVSVTLSSSGDCTYSKTINLSNIQKKEWASTQNKNITTGCIWRHLTDEINYNKFYGVVRPYVLEYPFSYPFQDELVQNVKDYTKAFKYLPQGKGVFTYNDKIAVDDVWFNKAILYNNQQSSGLLVLVPKPKNNLKNYMTYPMYNLLSKTIIYTKSDNFYHYNTFWSIVKDKQIPLFIDSCESLSIDKVVNQINMDYAIKSFKKETLRAKDLKVRHILDDRSDVHLVSQFILTPSQISFK
jgi:hypothetical protein